MKKPKQKITPPIELMPTPWPIPEWAQGTPSMPEYHLEMVEFATGDNFELEKIHITREEYIQLKVHLAMLRGFAPPKNLAEGAPRPGSEAAVEYFLTKKEAEESLGNAA